MGLFDWFAEKINPHDAECLRFLKGLASQEEPRISRTSFRQCFGFILLYPLVRVEIKYDSIRQTWKLTVDDNRTSETLYGYYVTFERADWATIDFLLTTYDLSENLQDRVAKHKLDMQRWRENEAATAHIREAKQADKRRLAQEVRNKYLAMDDGELSN